MGWRRPPKHRGKVSRNGTSKLCARLCGSSSRPRAEFSVSSSWRRLSRSWTQRGGRRGDLDDPRAKKCAHALPRAGSESVTECEGQAKRAADEEALPIPAGRLRGSSLLFRRRTATEQPAAAVVAPGHPRVFSAATGVCDPARCEIE